MAYEFRDRKQKQIYTDTSSSSDSDTESDPDYVKRRPQRNLISSTNNVNTNRGQVREVVLVAKIAGYTPPVRRSRMLTPTSSGRSGAIAASTSTTPPAKRKPGRPPKAKSMTSGCGVSSSLLLQQANQGPLVTRRRSKKRRASSFGSEKGGVAEDVAEKRTILALLIDLEIIKDNEVVYYVDMELNETNRGKVTRAGIHCDCCGQVVSVGKFEEHAYGIGNGRCGCKSDLLRKPYQNIVLEKSGFSLLQCQVSAWYMALEAGDLDVVNNVEPNTNDGDKNDDACMVCADGGDLICCEKCPSTFHPACLEMEGVPFGEWSCPYCVCKYCGASTGENLPIDFSKCILCDKTYHWGCYDQKELNLNTSCTQFCGDGCKDVYEKLQRIVGVKNELEAGLSWTLIRHTDMMSFNEITDIDLFYQMVECNCKIGIAWSLMDQSFEKIIDRYTGINLVRSVVCNASSNLSRINFRSFYTAILEKDDDIVAAASVRIHGKTMAEIPFVTTAKSYRGRGLMRMLMAAIESTLCHLEVKSIVIPSSEGVEKMWINNFYYSQKIDKTLEKHIVLSNMLMFPYAIRLQKTLLPNARSLHLQERSNSKRVPVLLDLNYEPPQEDEDMLHNPK